MPPKPATPAKPPRDKEITIAPEQKIHLQVVKGEKEIRSYTVHADEHGVVQLTETPPPDAPVADPDPVSGT